MMASPRIRSALCDYLDRESRERAQLRATLCAVASRLPETVIFGGMIREFAWGNARSFVSDIDLVANGSRAEVIAAVSQFSPKMNRFGGLRFVSGKRLFDIWALEDTWAFKERLVKGADFESLLKTTFFGVDAAIFHLTSRKYEFSEAHRRGVSERLLDLNLQPNPSPRKMAVRAVQMALRFDVAIAPALGRYVVENHGCSTGSSLEKSFLRALGEHLELKAEQPFRFRPQVSVLQA